MEEEVEEEEGEGERMRMEEEDVEEWGIVPQDEEEKEACSGRRRGERGDRGDGVNDGDVEMKDKAEIEEEKARGREGHIREKAF